MSLLICDYCKQEVESGIVNLLDHVEKCTENKTIVDHGYYSFTYTKPIMFSVIKENNELKKQLK